MLNWTLTKTNVFKNAVEVLSLLAYVKGIVHPAK